MVSREIFHKDQYKRTSNMPSLTYLFTNIPVVQALLTPDIWHAHRIVVDKHCNQHRPYEYARKVSATVAKTSIKRAFLNGQKSRHRLPTTEYANPDYGGGASTIVRNAGA